MKRKQRIGRIARAMLLGLTLAAFVGCTSPTAPQPREQEREDPGNDPPGQGMVIDGYRGILV